MQVALYDGRDAVATYLRDECGVGRWESELVVVDEGTWRARRGAASRTRRRSAPRGGRGGRSRGGRGWPAAPGTVARRGRRRAGSPPRPPAPPPAEEEPVVDVVVDAESEKPPVIFC